MVLDFGASGPDSDPGGRFSKVPKLYGPFSGVKIPFRSQERRELNWPFHRWLFGPKKFSRLSRNGSLAGDCVVFLGKSLYSHGTSLHPGVYKWVPAKCWG